MPPKRRRSSINSATEPLQPHLSASKIPRRRSASGTSSTIAAAAGNPGRRQSSLPPVGRVTSTKNTPKNSPELPKSTPYGDLRQLAKSLDPAKTQPQPTTRRPPQTPARKSQAAVRTPGTLKKTLKGTSAPGTVATPHTARAVKQLQLTAGRSGGVRKRNETRRESQRDVLRNLSRALAKDSTAPQTRRTNREISDSVSPPPPDLQSRLSTPSSDEIAPPRLSTTHDPLAPTRTLLRTPPTHANDTPLQSIEEARRAPFTRLSDRLSFGPASDEIEDTMMDILANRPGPVAFPDDSFDFGVPPAEEEDTIDLRAEAEEHGEYTEQLVSVQREASPELTSGQIKSKTSRPGRASHPTLPRDLIWKLAQQFASRQVTKDTFPYLQKATDMFFKNLSSDLAAFSQHARKKVINESDIQMLLQRQRLVKLGGAAKMSVFAVAQKYLPGELLGQVRVVKAGAKERRGRKGAQGSRAHTTK